MHHCNCPHLAKQITRAGSSMHTQSLTPIFVSPFPYSLYNSWHVIHFSSFGFPNTTVSCSLMTSLIIPSWFHLVFLSPCPLILMPFCSSFLHYLFILHSFLGWVTRAHSFSTVLMTSTWMSLAYARLINPNSYRMPLFGCASTLCNSLNISKSEVKYLQLILDISFSLNSSPFCLPLMPSPTTCH